MAFLAIFLCCEIARATKFRTPPARAKDAVWKHCGLEGDLITVPGTVRFGWASNWVEAELAAGATCSSASFQHQDPLPGVRKVCECTALTSANDKTELGISWHRCAREGSDCPCSSGIVRFGEDARWVTEEFGPLASVPCTIASFGADPALRKVKECWCADARSSRPKKAKVAVVMLSRHPPDLKTWIRYHTGHVGVDHIFIKLEDSPGVSAIFEQLPEEERKKVTLLDSKPAPASLIGMGADTRPEDDYTSLQGRQMVAMASAKSSSAAMGIDWLIHIDDDELLYTQYGKIGDLLAAMPQGTDQAYLPNVEAVYASANVKSCFTETKQANLNRFTFESYANGKSAVRVARRDAHPAGPHQWRDALNRELGSIHMDQEPFGSPIMVLHFESCPFSRWEDKFWELGRTSPQKVREIPFPFYRESITKMQSCRSRESGLPGCSQANLMAFWSKWKTAANPQLNQEDLMPVNIPWDTILA
eukprot:CAMPEP_0197655746 /NCGR_PEP_ID=MMETSP1338-20131121/39643_1 /TAXON_ID=43686 ORGANISM="Pelagodinium beii, Strain RCC1491" /NCGR_SAMPLE_ID=MMETSP1338 /ASSEMBLY_ACC=CAM_ASM_000754 /LENGTH=476 /DNA_ID=CAMNT_0043231457 /DNA_START=70 /DNA_END=1501 /DNA_ORIENTATION=+